MLLFIFRFYFAREPLRRLLSVSSSHVADIDPQDKWLKIVDNVKEATRIQGLKNEALEYMDKHPESAH
jgi:hypothetical protein